jgi:hypothetical protein
MSDVVYPPLDAGAHVAVDVDVRAEHEAYGGPCDVVEVCVPVGEGVTDQAAVVFGGQRAMTLSVDTNVPCGQQRSTEESIPRDVLRCWSEMRLPHGRRAPKLVWYSGTMNGDYPFETHSGYEDE